MLSLLPLLALAHAGERLPDVVQAAKLDVTLTVDPAEDTFTGQSRVMFQVTAEDKLKTFQLHAEELEIGKVIIRSGKKSWPATVEAVSDARIAVTSKKPLKPGEYYWVHLDYTGPVHTQPYGLYRFEHEGEPYLVTQLEADEARTVWPCFDEPEHKTGFSLTVTAPEGLAVVSNGPEKSQETVDGWTTHQFLPTLAIPTYAGALAVGPYDSVDVAGMRVPSKVYVPKGSTELAAPVAAGLGPAVDAAEAWFETSYPYQKLDVIVVPNFAFGAMENPGAVTLNASYVPDPTQPTPDQTYLLSEILGHEVSHMWFGNQVTMAWWDDFWLNESFAQWLGGTIAGDLHPEQRRSVDNVITKARIMRWEGRATTRPIRTDIDPAAVFETANFAVYPKGEALLDTIEAWIGPDAFREGVQSYITIHQNKNATAEDLFAALSEASGETVAPVLQPYLDRPGAPVVTLAGDPAAGTLYVSQDRFWQAGAEPTDSKPWPVPLRLKIGRPDGTSEIQTHWVDANETALEIGEWTWLHPQADGIGYYDYRVEDDALDALLANLDQLTVEERIGLVQALMSDVSAGVRTPAELLPIVSRFSEETDLKVLDEVVDIAGYVDVVQWTRDPDLVAAAHAYQREALRPLLDQVGIEPRPDEAAAAEDLRKNLLYRLADAKDPDVIAHARSLATRILEDPESVSPERRRWALSVFTEDADRATHERLMEMADDAPPAARSLYLSAAASVPADGVREEMLEMAIDPEVPMPDTMAVLFSATDADPWEADEIEQNVAWTMENYDAIAEKLPPQFRMYIAGTGTQGCDLDQIAKNRDFFLAEERRVPGVERVLSEAEEQARVCIAQRDARLPSMKAFLDARK